jgi:hypothetical protein
MLVFVKLAKEKGSSSIFLEGRPIITLFCFFFFGSTGVGI